MLNELIWNNLKCTMSKEVWEETGSEYEDLPIKIDFCGREEEVSLKLKYFDEMDEAEVFQVLEDFLASWSSLQKEVLEKLYKAYTNLLEERGEASSLVINAPEDMLEYVRLSTLIVDDLDGMCIGLGFDTDWDIKYDDYGDVGVLIINNEIVEVGSGDVIM